MASGAAVCLACGEMGRNGRGWRGGGELMGEVGGLGGVRRVLG